MITWAKEIVKRIPPKGWIILCVGIVIILSLFMVAVCIHGDDLLIALRFLLRGAEQPK